MKIKNDFVVYHKVQNIQYSKLIKINSSIVTHNDIFDVEQNHDAYFDYDSYNTITRHIYFNFDNISNIIDSGDTYYGKTYYTKLSITDISGCLLEQYFYIVKTDFNQLMRSFKLHQFKNLVL